MANAYVIILVCYGVLFEEYYMDKIQHIGITKIIMKGIKTKGNCIMIDTFFCDVFKMINMVDLNDINIENKSNINICNVMNGNQNEKYKCFEA